MINATINILCSIALLTTLLYVFHGFLKSIDESDHNKF